MKKTFLLVCSLMILSLLCSCIAVIETPSYSQRIDFTNESDAWMKMTFSNTDMKMEETFKAGETKTLTITSKIQNVEVVVTGPYFYDVSWNMDLLNCSSVCAVSPDAGLVKVSNLLDYEIFNVSFGDPRSEKFVKYNGDFTPSGNKDIGIGETKYITVAQSGATKAGIYFKKADGKTYLTNSYSRPGIGELLDVEIIEGIVNVYSPDGSGE